MSILVLILKIKNEILSIYSNVVAYSIEKKDFQNKYNNLFKKIQIMRTYVAIIRLAIQTILLDVDLANNKGLPTYTESPSQI